MGGRSMKDVRGAVLAGSTPPFLGRERAAVDVDVGPFFFVGQIVFCALALFSTAFVHFLYPRTSR